MANMLTVSRMVLAMIMMFLPAFSPAFYLLYILAGLSDIADGIAARYEGTANEAGARLDIADLVFILVCLYKLLPSLHLCPWLWLWDGAILLLRGANIALGYIGQHKLVMMHTWPNKITGLLMFLFPLTIP